MCNLYRMTKTPAEVAAWFDAIDATGGANFAAEVYPGYPGLVVTGGEVRRMSWGFPLSLKGKQGQPLKPRPVNNARSDKLGSPFWRHSFTTRRCLIPLTGWAEAEGPRGRMTRTWLSLPGEPLSAAAGLWRHSDEWGACYAMVMTAAAGCAAAEVHERMPVLLGREAWRGWMEGSPQEATELCGAWSGKVAIDRTAQSWAGGAGS